MDYPHYRVLSREDVASLCDKWNNDGDFEARDLLLTNYIDYILRRVKRRFGRYRYDVLHDVIAYLTERIHWYDPEKGSIVGYIDGAIKNTISMKRKDGEAYKRMLQFADVSVLFSDGITDDEGNDLVPYETEQLVCIDHRTPLTEMVRNEVGDRMDIIEKAMEVLTERQRITIEHVFLKGMTLRESADIQGCTYQCVQQAKESALLKMRIAIEPYRDDLR